MVPEKPSRAFIGISELSFHGENFEPAYVRHVRFGSKADMCSAKGHPDSDIRSVANASCWSCGARRRSYDGNFYTVCEGVVRRSSEADFGPGPLINRRQR